MKIDILENEKDMMKIELHDNLTFVNLLNERVWDSKPKFSTFAQDHPYLANPVLTVKGTNPKKMIVDAAEQIVTDAKELKKQLKSGK